MDSINLLLIEDNPGDIELTREALSLGKIVNKLQTVSDGEEALSYLFRRGEFECVTSPDVILLDLNLPKVSGREVLRQIKEDSELSATPVIILSSSEDAADIQATYDLHANCFITKPVQFDEFMRVVQAIETFWFEIVRLPAVEA